VSELGDQRVFAEGERAQGRAVPSAPGEPKGEAKDPHRVETVVLIGRIKPSVCERSACAR
jgi:hypothetical protein